MTPTPQARATHAAELRDHADEFAARYHCDDPLHPWHLAEMQQFTDWMDFTVKVADPIADPDTDDDDYDTKIQDAMRMFRIASPHYLCTALTMALNNIRRLEAENTAIRQQIAAEIEAEDLSEPTVVTIESWDQGYEAGLAYAARIARGDV